MKLLKTLTMLLGTMAVVFGIAISSAKAADKVVIAEPNWTGATAIAHVLKAVMEQYLGVEAEVQSLDTTVALVAMDKGDGSVDVYPDFWSQHRYAEWSKLIAPGSRETIRVNAKPYQGTEGLFIPGYVQDKHGIKKLEDLANPEIAKLFDTDGDGFGEYWPGGPGWNATDHQLVRMKSAGLDKYFKPFIVEQWVMEAKLDGAVKRELPVLFYFYTPEWLHAAYDLRKIEEAPFTGYSMDSAKDSPLYNADGCYHFLQSKEDPQWLEKSSITCQDPDVDVYVAHSKTLAERLPKVAQFLTQVAFTPEVINGWILKLSQEKVPAPDMAKAWIAENKDVVEKQWLAGIL